MTAEAALKAIAAALARDQGVAQGGMMGANALTISGKIFVMHTSAGELVYKLPRARVEALVASGKGKPWGPGGKRIMKEWVAVDPADADAIALAREAKLFVGGGKA